MRNDKKISKTVQAIRQLADDFLTMEETLGNQCASTDRIIESIIKRADVLKGLYEANFNQNQIPAEKKIHSHQVYGDVEDCWEALQQSTSLKELQETLDKMPRWSGEWVWFINNGAVTVRRADLDDTGYMVDDFEQRDITNLSDGDEWEEGEK